MVKNVLAYIIVLFLAPIVAGLGGIFLILLSDLIWKDKISDKARIWYDLFSGLTSIIIGFIAVWVGSLIFSWFGKKPAMLMVIMLGIGFGVNGFTRMRYSSKKIIRNELFATVGNLLGIIIGGFTF